jgi:hypothetical protein
MSTGVIVWNNLQQQDFIITASSKNGKFSSIDLGKGAQRKIPGLSGRYTDTIIFKRQDGLALTGCNACLDGETPPGGGYPIPPDNITIEVPIDVDITADTSTSMTQTGGETTASVGDEQPC